MVKITIPRRGQEKVDRYWLKPNRSKGKHIHIRKDVAENVVMNGRVFECELPDWYIKEEKLEEYINTGKVINNLKRI